MGALILRVYNKLRLFRRRMLLLSRVMMISSFLRSVGRMLVGVVFMAVRLISVMSSGLGLTLFMQFGGILVMFSRPTMMLSRSLVVLRSRMFISHR